MQGPDRDDEPQPVGRGDHPAAPVRGDRDLGLGADQDRRGLPDPFAVEIALLHADQPVLAQRRRAGLGHRGEPDVARPGDQQRRERQVQVVAAGLRPRQVRHRVQEPGAGVDLQQQLRVVDPRQHRRDSVMHRGEPLRRRGGLQPAQRQLPVLDARRVVGGQARADLLERAVQDVGGLGQVLARVGGQPERGQHGPPLPDPQPGLDQADTRIAPLVRPHPRTRRASCSVSSTQNT